VSYLVPIGSGLTLKAGKWATLIGYEVYETPKNLNFSRSFLYTLGTPYTNTGGLLSYQFTSWFGATVGLTQGWDNSDNNNGYVRPTGSFAFTPIDKLSATVNFLVGPEQNRNTMHNQVNNRWIVDTTILYTGFDKLTLAVNFDFAGEQNDPALVATRQDANSRWGGIAGYAAYDWLQALRTAIRLEYFSDPQGVRSSETVQPGNNVDLWEITATIEYKIWRGLVGRVEYRHDEANRKAFSLQNHGLTPTSHAQDTISVDLYYSFF
jgi:putative OmpL-like beta-barrel porin-2